MDPLLTIKAATYWPAVAMKVDKDYGTISEGKYADIMLSAEMCYAILTYFRMWIW